jgi:zinc-ribbon family
MGLIFFGSRKAKIGSYDVFMYVCPYCEQNNSTTITVLATYYHIFRIPFFPYAKEAIANCNNCKSRRNELKFGPKLVQEFRETRKRFKYPWWTWTWTIIFVGLILTIVVVAPK